VNAQLSGAGDDALAYAEWVTADPRFAGTRVSVYDAPGHAFPRLTLRYKSNLVQLEGGTQHLELSTPESRAHVLTPQQWREKLKARSAAAGDAAAPRPFLLDVRNGYEWDTGRFEARRCFACGALPCALPCALFAHAQRSSFSAFCACARARALQGAERPVTECFRETVEANSAPGGCAFSLLASHTRARMHTHTHTHTHTKGAHTPAGCRRALLLARPLADAPRDAPIMMYCTGGIRCDVYSAVLKEQGFTNLYTLRGGVQAYLDEFGSDGWEGHLFVFDARLAMTADRVPSALAGPEGAAAGGLKCHCCAAPRAVAPHRNCPNVDCNRLFLVCPACLASHGGFCCDECAAGVHVRPVLLQPGQHYARWSQYVDGPTSTAIGERRGEGRRLRRARRKERRHAQEHEWAVAAVVAALSGAPEAGAAAGADDGTAARRSRAARTAAALAGAKGWEDETDDVDEAAGAADGDEATWGLTGKSRYAKLRKSLRDEAAARLAAQQATPAPASA
jgi:predicted sulfurtransferase